jgi:hypothetical protein
MERGAMSSEDKTPRVGPKTAHEDAQEPRLREERWCATCHALMWICAACRYPQREWEHCANCGTDFRPLMTVV